MEIISKPYLLLYNDKLAVLQLLRYMVEIWESKIDKEKQKDLPVILPLLIYHDKGKWTAKTKLGDWIEGYNGLPEEMKKYIPDYEYLLYDLSTYSEEQVRLGIRSQVVMKMLSKARYASKKEALEVFKEAMIDRLTHKSYIVNMNGNSFMLKETKLWLEGQ